MARNTTKNIANLIIPNLALSKSVSFIEKLWNTSKSHGNRIYMYLIVNCVYKAVRNVSFYKKF